MSEVKMFDAFRRMPGTALADFAAHWSGTHAAIAVRIPQIRHYTQNHRLEHGSPALARFIGEPWCDGSSETWYDRAASVQEMMAEAALIELMHDEDNFMDMGMMRYPVMGVEHILDATHAYPAGGGAKILQFVRRPAGVSPGDFHARWLGGDDVALGRALGATRQVACVAVPESYAFVHPNPDLPDAREQPFDGVRELWWPSVDDLALSAEREPDAWRELLEAPAVDAARSFVLLARERVVIP